MLAGEEYTEGDIVSFNMPSSDTVKKLTEIFKELRPEAPVCFCNGRFFLSKGCKNRIVHLYINFNKMGDSYHMSDLEPMPSDDDEEDEEMIDVMPITIDFTDLWPIIKKFPSKSPFTFRINNDSTHYTVEWTDKSRTSSFTFPIITCEDDDLSEPKAVTPQLKLKVSSSSLKEICDEMQVSKTKVIRMLIEDGNLTFLSGDKNGICNVRIIKDIRTTGDEGVIDSDFKFDATFLLDRIQPLVKSPMSKETEIWFISDEEDGTKSIQLHQSFDTGEAVFSLTAKREEDALED